MCPEGRGGEGRDEEEEEERARTGGQCSFPIFIPPL